MILPYRGWWIMLYEYGWYLPKRGGAFQDCYYSDVRLAASRDGLHYTRIEPHEKVIPLGPGGAWDAGLIVVADKAVVKDDTIYLYYCGNGQECGGWRRRTGSRVCRMGLATLKLDRFTCLETCDGDSFGHAVTAPITVRDAARVRLVLNVSGTAPDRSWIEVDVLDAAAGQPPAGYADPDCIPVDEDGLSVPVRWKTQETLADVACQNIQLRFRLYGAAKLYSFCFCVAEE